MAIAHSSVICRHPQSPVALLSSSNPSNAHSWLLHATSHIPLLSMCCRQAAAGWRSARRWHASGHEGCVQKGRTPQSEQSRPNSQSPAPPPSPKSSQTPTFASSTCHRDTRSLGMAFMCSHRRGRVSGHAHTTCEPPHFFAHAAHVTPRCRKPSRHVGGLQYV